MTEKTSKMMTIRVALPRPKWVKILIIINQHYYREVLAQLLERVRSVDVGNKNQTVPCSEGNGTTCSTASIYEFRYSFPVTVFFCLAYTSVFLIGVTGNCFVVSVVYRSPRMRSPTNLFIANLACADLLVNVICLPFTLISNVMTDCDK
uniref:G_PROTEIN_RECEP_F1_2 domain-containing protein n=1 Tax=Rhodnius prolixus TaxID=13249 RepID=T1IBR8_RHOPR